MTGDRTHELTRAEESQAIALIPAMLDEIRAQRAIIELMAARLPSTWLSLREAAKRMGVDPRTVAALLPKGTFCTSCSQERHPRYH
jgi:predicted DNA-binding protein (UPF0251 family)